MAKDVKHDTMMLSCVKMISRSNINMLELLNCRRGVAEDMGKGMHVHYGSLTRCTCKTLGLLWGMLIRTWYQGMSFRFILPRWKYTNTLRLVWEMRVIIWHQGMLFRFTLPLRKRHQGFRFGWA